MFSIESKSMPNPNYIDTQHEIKWPMRAILVDWLIDVHAKFALLPETLFLAINIVDRFLSLRVVSLAKLQLVGITAMFVAAKYEEIMAPSVTAFIYMSDGGYSVEEVLKAERYLMGVLEFDLSFPNPLNFLRRISKADDYDLATRTVSKYLMEIPLLDHRFLQYRPSQIAAAAMWFSRRMLSRGPWGPNLVHYSGYAEDELMPIVHLLHESLRQKEIKYESLYKKYTHKRFMKASVFCREWAEKRPKAQDL
jgi:G2/mitotic-specific cyclin 1/2